MPYTGRRTTRQTDYNAFSSDTPIVIDNGGSTFRIGWAGESNPRVAFRNVVQRPRHKATGETETIVGDCDPSLLKYFDCTRSFLRSPFECDVVYQFELMEYILDFGFLRMGADGSEGVHSCSIARLQKEGKRGRSAAAVNAIVSGCLKAGVSRSGRGDLFPAFDWVSSAGEGSGDLKQSGHVGHPVLMTECVYNPLQSRSKMAELLFESYGVPSVAFGVDAAFSYKRNQQLGICSGDGLAVSSGFNASYVIPFIHGEPVFESCCRTNISGYHITDYLKQLLSLKHPYHISNLTWEKVEDLKIEHCYLAEDYASELQLFQKGAKEAEEKTRCWQLPWVPPPREELPSEEEIARKAALKEKQGQRLRDMAAAKRSSKIMELENELPRLEFLLEQLERVDEHEVKSFLAKTGYLSRQEIESAILKMTQSLRKIKGETLEADEKVDTASTEKYPLLNVPDSTLTPEQIKEKKRQQFIKFTSEGRQRAKEKRAEEELQRERQNQEDEERCLENPELYLEELHTKYRQLSEKVDQRRRLKTNGSRLNGNHSSSGAVGRGERLNAAQKERMRLLTTAAFDRGKGEDTFGAKDEDWQLYKLMSKDNDDEDDGPDEDETELVRITSRLQDIDPNFVALQSRTEAALQARPLTAEDFQIVLGVERFRCPEILFQPTMVGIDQAGLDEMVGISMRRLHFKDDTIDARITKSILMTGGSCLFSGMEARLESGVRKIRPFMSPIRVVRASDPVLDAWRGAATFAASQYFVSQTFTKQDYDEKGEDWLRKYQLRYML